MSYQSPMDQQLAMQALMQGFMTEVDVIMQAYGDYDKHFLSILDKAEYHQRVRRIATISKTYIDMTLEKNALARLLDAVDDRIDESISRPEADAWRKLRVGPYILWARVSDILGQAEAQIAAFRSMALVKAFEQFKADAEQITGVPMKKYMKIKDKVEAEKEKKKQTMKEKAKAKLKRRGKGDTEKTG